MIGHEDDTWVCISDLFAGLMAFFVFVSVGILTNADNSAGDIKAKPRAGIVKPAPSQPLNTPPVMPVMPVEAGEKAGIRYIERGLVIETAIFKNDSAQIDGDSEQVLDQLGTVLASIIKSNKTKTKILFTGHSSCKCKTMSTDAFENYIQAYTYNMRLSLERAAEICRRMKRRGVLDSFRDADIRFRGMSEDMAAATQEGNLCVDRMRDEAEEAPFRIVAIELYDEWPDLPMPKYIKQKYDEVQNLVATKKR